MNHLPKSRTNNLVVQELDRELLTYDLITNKAVCLNETRALVWRMCDGSHSLQTMAHAVSREYGQPVDETFVWLALEQLEKEDLLENQIQVPVALEGLSRRQLIRKAGLASLIALPIVTSMIAPTSAMAASGTAARTLALGDMCSQSGPDTCVAGSSCIACIGGICGGAMACCADGSAGYGRNFVLEPCTVRAICTSRERNCCSLTATFTVNGCNAQFPDLGSCVCD